MAIGYHKINTSAARAKKNNNRSTDSEKVTVYAAGVRVTDPIYGDGVTLDDFVASTDSVRVQFSAGVVSLFGGNIKNILSRQQ